MSEYWKSTPNYWCKYCSRYVRDTKLERANHERTGMHQGALKRELRGLHRNHEQSEREKERVKAEVDRLNKLVGDSGDGKLSAGTAATAPGQKTSAYGQQQQTSVAERQTQMEQLAVLGVAIPGDLRGDMAMPGEWTVTSTRVVDEDEEARMEKRAVGVRKRVVTEEEEEVEEAVRDMAKRKKRIKWGTKLVEEADEELDALLSGDLVKPEKAEVGEAEKNEDGVKSDEQSKKEAKSAIKEDQDGDMVRREEEVKLKLEPSEENSGPIPTPEASEEGSAPAPIFKKRKAKNIRQK